MPVTPPQKTAAARSTRQYRSRVRSQPCDRCRQQKRACKVVGGQTPCQRCRLQRLDCSFQSRADNRSAPRPEAGQASETASTAHGVSPSVVSVANEMGPSGARQASQTANEELSSPGLWPATTSAAGPLGPLSAEVPLAANREPAPETWLPSVDVGAVPLPAPKDRASTQIAQSLDSFDNHSIQLIGASAEADPWLLRHCRFDDYGFCPVQNVHVRNAGGVPTDAKIPIQLMVFPDQTAQGAIGDIKPPPQYDDCRFELDSLVLPRHGQNLVHLYMKHVFNHLPVICRTQLGLTSISTITNIDTLNQLPVHLLAAIYATALPYALEDAELALLQAHEQPPVHSLWKLVYELISVEIHRPRLSVLQAAILYLHKDTRDKIGQVTVDTPFSWSFLGSVIGLATTLGLNIECQMWAVPAWEKRLQRRLWWTVYMEDKWRSLLMGRPPLIHPDEWDVTEPSATDFVLADGATTGPTEGWRAFRDSVQLARIAESIQSEFYSLKASQALFGSIAGSFQVAKPLLDRLSVWRGNCAILRPVPRPDHSNRDSITSYMPSLHFSYLVLVAYIHRALLRPTVQNSQPPQILDLDNFDFDAMITFDESSWTFSWAGPASDPEPPTGGDAAALCLEALYSAAENCARALVDFTSGLTCADLGTFWYSWMRLGFAAGSSFLALLWVQAPTFEHAVEAKSLLSNWRKALQHQSRASDMLLLAFARANAWAADPSRIFSMPTHVEQSLQKPSRIA